MRDPVQTKLRCPRCRGRDLQLTESGTWTSSWVVKNGHFDRCEGNHEPESVDRLDAACRNCQHRWKPRGANQIDDIVTGVA